MNKEEQHNFGQAQEASSQMHRDIMRSVQVVNRRYYLFGLATGFFAALVTMSWVVYTNMVDEGTFEFLSTMSDILKSNFSLITDFGDELKEFFPLGNIEIWTVMLLVTALLILVVFRFRKALFIKVENFSDTKTKKEDI